MDGDACPLLDFVDSLGKPGPILALFETVAEHGARRLMKPKTDMCARLRDGIYEFRKNPKGAKIRVLWFYGTTGQSEEPLTIVCTHGFLKDTASVEAAEVGSAITERERYFRDEKAGKIEVYNPDGLRVR